MEWRDLSTFEMLYMRIWPLEMTFRSHAEHRSLRWNKPAIVLSHLKIRTVIMGSLKLSNIYFYVSEINYYTSFMRLLSPPTAYSNVFTLLLVGWFVCLSANRIIQNAEKRFHETLRVGWAWYRVESARFLGDLRSGLGFFHFTLTFKVFYLECIMFILCRPIGYDGCYSGLPRSCRKQSSPFLPVLLYSSPLAILPAIVHQPLFSTFPSVISFSSVPGLFRDKNTNEKLSIVTSAYARVTQQSS